MKRFNPTTEHAARAIQDQRLLDIAAQADAREGIRQGLEDAHKGRSRPAGEFFREFEAEYLIVPRRTLKGSDSWLEIPLLIDCPPSAAKAASPTCTIGTSGTRALPGFVSTRR